MRTVRWTASVAVLALVSACAAGPTGGDADGGTATAPPATTEPDAEAAPDTDPSADPVGPDGGPEHDLLAFSGRRLDGGDFDGAVVTGDVLVWFWAPW